jgi:uncharacterized pyridoxamine 5'-phosphate oxidase family protein
MLIFKGFFKTLKKNPQIIIVGGRGDKRWIPSEIVNKVFNEMPSGFFFSLMANL